MSYDPYDSDVPRPGDPYDPSDRSLAGDTERIKARVQAPAIGLIVLGIVNLFWAIYLVFNSLVLTVTPADQLKANQMAVFEHIAPALKAEAANKSADEMKMQALIIYWPLTLFALLASILPLAGGIRIMALKSYALGICGAIVAAIPCVSGTACCGVGEGIGIWALVVLLNADVKSAFR